MQHRTLRTVALLAVVAALFAVGLAPAQEDAPAPLDLSGSFLFQTHPQGLVLLSPIPDDTPCRDIGKKGVLYCGRVEFDVYLSPTDPVPATGSGPVKAEVNLRRATWPPRSR